MIDLNMQGLPVTPINSKQDAHPANPAHAVSHRLQLVSISNGRATIAHSGNVIGCSYEPLLAGSRKLLDLGLAKPEDRVETYRIDAQGQTIVHMRSTIGGAAKLTVEEKVSGGIGFREYNSSPSQRMAA